MGEPFVGNHNASFSRIIALLVERSAAATAAVHSKQGRRCQTRQLRHPGKPTMSFSVFLASTIHGPIQHDDNTHGTRSWILPNLQSTVFWPAPTTGAPTARPKQFATKYPRHSGQLNECDE
ncbi:uncharacterized protein PV06_08149 [Exophiala oligosperma]|uniref:Uncharacterized protein n=1 Tax=Exophiala oligosperma TaxID=215243 RepID=A0A0D2D8Y4_9EURO|nr:uncharacterized protein PV06_08149 [Exophiala oligosperma]KIW39548.1 hypothetical protein PV06_08149 [Exophiala oligosperma]